MTKDLIKSNKKGITPIIAIIILLLITIALAGAAYSYISAYWTTTTKNIQIINGYCTGGNTANVLVRNMGTSRVSLSEIEILDTATGLPVVNPSGKANWTTIDGTLAIEGLDQGKTGKFNATCPGYCTYRFIYGGAVGSGAPISIAC